MSYADILELYLMKKGSFTHKDIARVTNGNCSYSILRDLRAKLRTRNAELIEVWEVNPKTKKRYKRYKELLA